MKEATWLVVGAIVGAVIGLKFGEPALGVLIGAFGALLILARIKRRHHHRRR